MHRVLLLVLVSGCSLFGVGRGSFGVTGSTDGTVGLSASLELGGGWVDTPHEITPDAARSGESVSLFGGGGVSTRGAEIEAGGRAEYVQLTGHRLLRIGARQGVLARQHTDALLAFDAALGMGWPVSWEPRRAQYFGFELRAGPAFAIVDDPVTTRAQLHWHAARFYAGVVHDRFAIRGHRYDPLDAIIGDPKGSH